MLNRLVKKWLKVGVIFIVVLSMTGWMVSTGMAQKKVNLIVQMFGGPEARAMLPTIEYWNKHYAEQTGIYVKQNTVSRQGYFEKLSSQLVSGVSVPDVIHPFCYSVGKFYPYLFPLDEYLADPKLFSSPSGEPYSLDWAFPVGLELGQFNGKQYFLPLDISEVVTYWRKDVLDSPPETWEELVDEACRWTKRLNPDSPTRYGMAWMGKYEMWNFTAFQEILWSYGADYFKEGTWEPDLASKEAIEAARILEQLGFKGKNVLPPDVLTYEYPEVLAALATGQVAFAMEWNAAWPDLINPEQSPLVYDKLALAPPPGVRQPDGSIKRYMMALSINFAINKASKYRKEAFKFIAWATFGEGNKYYVERGGGSGIRENWRTGPEPLSIIYPWAEKYFRAYIVFPEAAEVTMMGSRYLQDIISGEKTAEEGMKALNEEVKSYLKKKPMYFKNGKWLKRE